MHDTKQRLCDFSTLNMIMDIVIAPNCMKRMMMLRWKGAHRFSSHHGVQVFQLGKDTRLPLVKEGIDGFLDDADWMVWSPMEICANLGKDALRDIVEGMTGEHLCTLQI